jgi:GMP synthase PP-ATPase subunit
MGCRLLAIGPSAVGVQGDARTYGVSVVIRVPEQMAADQTSYIATLITNHVGEVTRVLRDIPVHRAI